MTKSSSIKASSTGKPVVLVGMMGVGKSSVGKRLAEKLGLPFVDSDDEIEAAANMSIAEIFETYGEPHFRDGERRVIQRLISAAPAVVATGGGAFVDQETRALIREKAVSIWLDADLDMLVERLSQRDHRPLLRGKSRKEIRDILTQLATTRNPLYGEADHHVMSDKGPHGKTVEAILKVLNNG